jgi:photosystem II stability/assembly factor-like uncharacterized protein
MKLSKFLIPSLLCAASAMPLHETSASETSYLAPLVTESLLLDIIATGEKLVAVGERGHILISTDGGKNWQQKTVPTLSTLTGVFAIGDAMWVVGHDSIILKSSDGGESWAIQQFLPDLERPLMDVFFFDENQGIAIGAYGVFFRTMDGGVNWEREYHPTFLHPDDQAYVEELKAEDEEFYQEEMASILPHLNRVNADGNRLLVAGESGLVAYSEDQGNSWQRVETDYYGSFFDITKLGDDKVLAAGLRGNLYISDAQMQDWDRANTGTTATFNSIVPLGANKALLVGNNGTLATWSDGNVELDKTADGENVLNAVDLGTDIVAVSAVGIKSLARD